MFFGRSPEGLSDTVFAKKYQVHEEVGRGGMSIVYRATQLDDSLEVALKIAAGLALDDKAALKRLIQEGKLLTDLHHPHLVQVFEVGKAKGLYFIVMEYLGGGMLKDMIQRKGMLREKEALQMIMPVAEALWYVHKNGIIHGDLKPSNIMLNGKGNLKIMDFGLAELSFEQDDKDRRRTGTPTYMSPEQVQGHRLDFRSDIYSLGVTLYELITERVPFPGTDMKSVLTKQLMFVPKSPKVYNHELSKDLEAMVMSMLDKNPKNRPPNMDIVLSELKRILENGSGA